MLECSWKNFKKLVKILWKLEEILEKLREDFQEILRKFWEIPEATIGYSK